MNTMKEQTKKKAAFTIVELLTVMSIIIILIGLLVPALNRVRRYTRRVRQKAQFHSIEVAMELFATDFDDFPSSNAKDENGDDYCGATKLCEAMMGQDLLGFHPYSHFNSDDGVGADELYPDNPPDPPDAAYLANLRLREGPYLQLESANTYKLKNLYGSGKTGLLDEDRFVLCDAYRCVTPRTAGVGDTGLGSKTGMPILYYRADTSKTNHNVDTPTDPRNIYNYRDNEELVKLGLPWEQSPGIYHPLYKDEMLTSDWERFYVDTKNDKITTTSRPYRVDSYILLSAGFDGQYGTSDDVFNFGD